MSGPKLKQANDLLSLSTFVYVSLCGQKCYVMVSRNTYAYIDQQQQQLCAEL